MRKSTCFVLGLAALVSGAASAYADLDVGVPPGTPLDWVSSMPRRIPTGTVRIPTGVQPEKKDEQPRTVSRGADVPRTHVSGSDLGAVLPMSYARILTPDITRHLEWVNLRPTQETFEGKKTATGAGKDGPEVHAAYPPVVGEDLQWLALAFLLRKLVHPNLISDAESEHVLIGMGEAALPALTAAENQAALKPWIEQIRADVGQLPARKPHALANGRSPEEKMLLRLAAEDLSSGYPSGLDGDFAQHLLALDAEETVPLLVKYLEESDHPFLKRNACAVLGNYVGDLPTGALVRAFNDTKDAVIRERAIDALARRRSTAILPTLERAAVAKGLPQTLAIWALGAIGDPKGAHWCVRALSKTDDPDLLWAAIPAVARAQHDKPKEAITALRTLARWLLDAADGTFEEKPALEADVPDGSLLKVSCLLEMAIVALAKLGDEPARKDLWKLLAGDAPELAPRKKKAAAQQAPIASKGTFGSLHVPCLVLLVETLPSLGEAGRKRLQVIAADTVCDTALRLMAIDALAQMKALTVEFLTPLVDDSSIPLRARALKYLWPLDPKAARKQALEFIRAYTVAKPSASDVVAAIQLVAADKAVKFPIKRFTKALKYAAEGALAKPAPANPNDRTIETRPPILEELLLGLGASGDPAAVELLVAHARTKKNAARATAVAALGGFATTRGALISFLSDEDGWVRYVAYRVLHKKAPEVDAFADWLYGTPAERAPAVEKWKNWLAEEAIKAADAEKGAEKKEDDKRPSDDE